jgi:predicted aspartyl protease
LTEKLRIKTKNGTMFVSVRFWSNADNGYCTVSLLLDTGAVVTTVSESALRRLGCSVSGEAVPIRTAIGYGSVLKAVIPKLKIASFEFADMNVHAHTFPDSCDFDGVLGMDILGKFNFGFNLDENSMELTTRGGMSIDN